MLRAPSRLLYIIHNCLSLGPQFPSELGIFSCWEQFFEDIPRLVVWHFGVLQGPLNYQAYLVSKVRPGGFEKCRIILIASARSSFRFGLVVVGFDKGSVPPAIIRSQENFIFVRDSSLWRKATVIVYETEQPCRVAHQEVDIDDWASWHAKTAGDRRVSNCLNNVTSMMG